MDKRERLTRKWKSSEVFTALLIVAGLMFGSFYLTPPISASSPQNTCIGIGGWPCGYTGPFTGEYYAGYPTLGCTPTDLNSPCVVPQIARVSSFLVISNASYVIDWANQSFQWSNGLADGSTISVSGDLAPIFYNKTAGSMFMIYASNAKGLWNPQPQLEIRYAIVNDSIDRFSNYTIAINRFNLHNNVNVYIKRTTEWKSTLPMVPQGACNTVRNIAQQQSYAVGNVDIPIHC